MNVPPTREGLFHENDVGRLHEIGEYLRKAFAVNLLEEAKVTAGMRVQEEQQAFEEAKNCGSGEGEISIKESVLKDDYETWYQGGVGENVAVIQAEWKDPVNVGHVVLKENVKLSQRVEHFQVLVRMDGVFQKVFEGTVIGYKRIIPFPQGLRTDCLRIVITDSRMEPTIAFLGIYEK